jgi:hypothetical protein
MSDDTVMTVNAIGPFDAKIKKVSPTLVAYAMVKAIEESGFQPLQYVTGERDIEEDGAVPAFEAMIAVITLFLQTMVVLEYVEIDEAYRRLYSASISPQITATKDQRVIDSHILITYLFPSIAERFILVSSILLMSGIVTDNEDPLKAFYHMALATIFLSEN